MSPAKDKTREYLRTQIQTASREQLVLMLYDGAIRFTAQARERLAGGDFEGAHHLLIRAQNIVLELLFALDRKAGGAVADNLASLYTYCYHRLIEANIHRSSEKIDECAGILQGLRDAWARAVASLKQGPDPARAQNGQAAAQT